MNFVNIGLAVLLLIYFVSTNEAFDVNELNFEQILQSTLKEHSSDILPQELVEQLIQKFQRTARLEEIKDIKVIVNEYADKIFENLHRVILENNLDSIALPNTTLKLKPTGTIDLTSGILKDLHTVGRGGDVEVEFEDSSEKVSLSLPISFGILEFNYHYHTKVTIISISGGVEGSVKNIKVNAKLSFDLKDFHSKLEDYNMKNTGDISVKFTGHSMIDWLTNSMTKVFTVFFGPVIVNVIEKIVKNTLEELISKLNDIVDKIFNH